MCEFVIGIFCEFFFEELREVGECGVGFDVVLVVVVVVVEGVDVVEEMEG